LNIELDVEGLPAPGDAPARSGVPAEVDAEVKVEQLDVEIKTEVKSEMTPPGERLAKRAPVPPEGGTAAPAAAVGGAFCRCSHARLVCV
jgi:hypothetical protein